ncbi:methyltransferase domain-containing protein [Streptomyces californicus]
MDWLRHAYADTAVVTQVNDGGTAAPGERWASSSASAPSIVFRMLDLLDVRPGHRVLEIGTGTGWNAALLAHRLGPGPVTTVEVDPALAARAAARLEDAGLGVRTVRGDGARGAGAEGPYDRTVATCSVRSVPPAWIEGTRPGGIVLVPWESPWLCYGLLRLTVDGYGGASGSFSPYSAFMLMRGQRTDLRIYRDVVRDHHVPQESATRLAPGGRRRGLGRAVRDRAATARRLADLAREPRRQGRRLPPLAGHHRRGLRAAVDLDGRTTDRFTVWEHGPRRLWASVEAAHGWWRESGRPGPERFGLTIAPDGRHTPWLDTPDNPVPVRG